MVIFGPRLDPVLLGRGMDLLANVDGAQLRGGTGPENCFPKILLHPKN